MNRVAFKMLVESIEAGDCFPHAAVSMVQSINVSMYTY